MRTAFEIVAYDVCGKSDLDQLSCWQTARWEKTSTEIKCGVLSIFAGVLEAPQSEIGIITGLFYLGMSSVEMRRITSTIKKTIKPQQAVAIVSVMLNPTIRKLAASLKPSSIKIHKPAVNLKARGSGTPLWLLHPGVGEILVFSASPVT